MSHESPDIEAILESCSRARLRRTKALVGFVEALASADQPMTLQQISESESFADDPCDPATLYRLATKLEEHRIVRRIGFHSRAAHYSLRESLHQDYLVCRDCGTVEVLDIACPVHGLEKQIADTSGFDDVEHELEFYGRCGDCQT